MVIVDDVDVITAEVVDDGVLKAVIDRDQRRHEEDFDFDETTTTTIPPNTTNDRS